MDRLRLQPSQQSQRLGIPLEPADVGRDLVQRRLAVVAERRVPEVVRQAGGVDDVGVAAERLAQLAADLRDLQRMGQPVADEVVRSGRDHLGLGGQPTQRCGVHDPGAVTFEGRPLRPLRRLGRPPVAVAVLVPAHTRLLSDAAVSGCRYPGPRPAWTEARPASRRATGTRNGEQDT